MVSGFDPVVSSESRVLILGTIPGVASLEAGEYYAHPQNAFWPIMHSLFGIDDGADYGIRTAALTECGVALWDVLAEAERPGSLDSDIRAGSMTTNYFPGFLAAHPKIRTIFFNGRTAQKLFEQLVLPGLDMAGTRLSLRYLPSTSPAHAVKLEQKLLDWAAVKEAVRVT